MTYYHTVLFKSRNKDNKEVDEFKERSKTFLTDKEPIELYDKFQEFVGEGLDGELSRSYFSLNRRDIVKANKKLVHYLIDNPEFPPYKLQTKLVSLASEKDCAAENKWLFDYDGEPDDVLSFVEEVEQHFDVEGFGAIQLFRTVTGFGIIAPHGFDTRELLAKWPEVELHRDGMMLVDHQTRSEKV